MKVVSLVTSENVSVEVWAEGRLEEFKQVSGHEAAEIRTFSLKQTRERKVTRGKHGCGKIHCFKIGAPCTSL